MGYGPAPGGVNPLVPSTLLQCPCRQEWPQGTRSDAFVELQRVSDTAGNEANPYWDLMILVDCPGGCQDPTTALPTPGSWSKLGEGNPKFDFSCGRLGTVKNRVKLPRRKKIQNNIKLPNKTGDIFICLLWLGNTSKKGIPEGTPNRGMGR